MFFRLHGFSGIIKLNQRGILFLDLLRRCFFSHRLQFCKRLHVIKLHTFIENDCLKARERLVDKFLHHRIRRKGYFGMTIDEHTRTSIHIYTLTGIDTDYLKRAKALHFHLSILVNAGTNHLKDGCNE